MIAHRRSHRSTGRRGAIWRAVVIGGFLAWSLLPVLWVAKLSISPRRDLFASPPPLLPSEPTLSSYATIFTDPLFRQALANSALIAGATTAICVVLGGMAAYPLARLRFRGRTFLMTGILALAFFPTVAIIAPLFKQFRALGVLDTYVAVIAVDTVFALPLTIWLLVAFFRQLPPDLEEAARVDGAGLAQTIWRIVLPLSAPGVATAAILTFLFAWNEFLLANTFLFDQNRWPVTVVIPTYATIRTVDYGAQAAAALVVTVPLVLAVLVGQRRIVAGLTAGAVKG